MKHSHVFFMTVSICLLLMFQGCSVFTLKQLSRNNLNQETLDTIVLCRTTKSEIVKLFRAPTDDFIWHQGDNEVYVYKGFGGRMKIDTQKLEIMFNEDDIVVDYRMNYEGTGPMLDQCKYK